MARFMIGPPQLRDNAHHHGIHLESQWCLSVAPYCTVASEQIREAAEAEAEAEPYGAAWDEPEPLPRDVEPIPNARMRVMRCPDNHFVIVIDRAEDIFDVSDRAEWMREVADAMAKRMPKLGAVMVFRNEVDLD